MDDSNFNLHHVGNGNGTGRQSNTCIFDQHELARDSNDLFLSFESFICGRGAQRHAYILNIIGSTCAELSQSPSRVEFEFNLLSWLADRHPTP